MLKINQFHELPSYLLLTSKGGAITPKITQKPQKQFHNTPLSACLNEISLYRKHFSLSNIKISASFEFIATYFNPPAANSQQKPLFNNQKGLSIDHTAIGIEQKSLCIDHTAVGIEQKGLGIDHTAVDIEQKGLCIDHTAVDIEQKSLCIDHTAIDIEQKGLGIDHTAADIEQKGLCIDHTAAVIKQISLCIGHKATNGGFFEQCNLRFSNKI